MQRSGKSTLLELYRESLHKLGVGKKQIQFYNFELPGDLGYLSQLNTLVLSQINLSGLQASFSELTKLEILILSDNKLSTVPESLFSLKN